MSYFNDADNRDPCYDVKRLKEVNAELLEALKEMLDLYIWDSDASDRAKAAIAKAEGRS